MSMEVDVNEEKSLEAVHYLSLWIGLREHQADQLLKEGRLGPYPYQHFALRTDALEAIRRAYLWCDNEGYREKDMIALKIDITAVGFTTLSVNQILQDRGGGWYRWYGQLQVANGGLYTIDPASGQKIA